MSPFAHTTSTYDDDTTQTGPLYNPTAFVIAGAGGLHIAYFRTQFKPTVMRLETSQ